ncbi:MAG: hypothetical protein IKX22_05340 [Prevotella sp.]|nr:hypothetical protein [Prevotella sp.]
MTNNNDKRRVLKMIVWGNILLALVLVILFETHVLPSGNLAGEKNTEFVVLTVAELMALALIPFAVGMVRIKFFRTKMQQNYMPWAVLRLGLLAFLMLANTVCYYLFANVAFGYLAIIAALCLLVVFPTRERCANEMEKKNDEQQ